MKLPVVCMSFKTRCFCENLQITCCQTWQKNRILLAAANRTWFTVLRGRSRVAESYPPAKIKYRKTSKWQKIHTENRGHRKDRKRGETGTTMDTGATMKTMNRPIVRMTTGKTETISAIPIRIGAFIDYLTRKTRIKMDDEKLAVVNDLSKLIKTTKKAVEDLQKVKKASTKESVGGHYGRDFNYSLYICECGDGSGFKINLSRYLGNTKLLDVIFNELEKQLLEYESEYKKL